MDPDSDEPNNPILDLIFSVGEYPFVFKLFELHKKKKTLWGNSQQVKEDSEDHESKRTFAFVERSLVKLETCGSNCHETARDGYSIVDNLIRSLVQMITDS